MQALHNQRVRINSLERESHLKITLPRDQVWTPFLEACGNGPFPSLAVGRTSPLQHSPPIYDLPSCLGKKDKRRAMLLAGCVQLMAFSPSLEQHLAPTPALRRMHAAQMQLQYDPSTYNPEVSGLNVQAAVGTMDRPEGAHGTGYRFMPLETVPKDTAPAVVCIAGAFPGLTRDQLAAPQPMPFAPPGSWNYHMLTGDAAPGGFVAVPGNQLLDGSPNTVAVVCMSRSLGLEFPDGQEHEVLALIDRSDPATFDPDEFDKGSFYAVSDPAGIISIRWYDVIPEGHSICGRLLFTQMPHVVRPGASQGFAEGSDEFEF